MIENFQEESVEMERSMMEDTGAKGGLGGRAESAAVAGAVRAVAALTRV